MAWVMGLLHVFLEEACGYEESARADFNRLTFIVQGLTLSNRLSVALWLFSFGSQWVPGRLCS